MRHVSKVLIVTLAVALTACGGAPRLPSVPIATQSVESSPTQLPPTEPAEVAPTGVPATPAPEATEAGAGGSRPVARGEISPELVAANSRFGFKLFAELLKAEPGSNVFISPASVAIALAMTYNGASAATQEAMAQTLELQGMSLDEANQAYAALLQTLETADPKVQLAIANSLWARQDIQFNTDFLQRVKLFYDAEVTSLDFTSPSSVDTINGWVNENTNGKIPTILDQISGDAILYLINAIYFKGTWIKAFDPKLTQDSMFNLLGGSQKQVPMMMRSDAFRYLRGDGFQAVSLPYGEKDGEGRFSMYVFLPDEGSSLDALLNGLTAERWNEWMAMFGPAEGDLAMPRYRLEYEVGLNDALKALGMAVAFDPQQADFSAMVDLKPENVFISNVKHKTFVEVNEEGTEAAAVTSVEMGVTSAREEPQRFSMIVDRPFFVAIRDDQSGEVLFMGAIVAP